MCFLAVMLASFLALQAVCGNSSHNWLVNTLVDVQASMDGKSYQECSPTAKRKLNQYSAFATPVPLPLDSTKMITGIISEETRIFASGLNPLLVAFKIRGTEKPYKAIFKTGDDLRDDEFVIKFLHRAQGFLDGARLTCYNAIALSEDMGLIQFVEGAETLGDIPSITQYLKGDQSHNTFVQTAADYTALMYVLGVGDRHSDNLMLLPDGHLFHIDFGFLFGANPWLNKMLAPKVILPPRMVSVMGGPEHTTFGAFRARLLNTLLMLRAKSDALIKVFDEAPQTKEYFKGRQYVRARLNGNISVRLVSESVNSRWVAFYDRMAIRDSVRRPLEVLSVTHPLTRVQRPSSPPEPKDISAWTQFCNLILSQF